MRSADLRRGLASCGTALGLLRATAPLGSLAWVLLAVVDALLPPLQAIVAAAIVDAVVAGDVRAALVWVGAEAGLVVGRSVLYHLDDYLKTVLGARLSVHVNGLVLGKAIDVRLQHFEDPSFADRLARASREAGSRPLHLVRQGMDALRSGVTLVSYAAILAGFAAWLPAVVAAGTAPQFATQTWAALRFFRLQQGRTHEERRAWYLKDALVGEPFAKEVRLLGAGRWLLDRFQGYLWAFFRQDRDLTRRTLAWNFATRILATLVFYGLYALIAWRAARGEITLGQMTMYVMAVRGGQQSFEGALNAASKVWEDALYMDNLREFLALPADEPFRPLRPQGEPRPAAVALDDVSFAYPGTSAPALSGVSLSVGPGETLALVGPNGAGKTTLVKLLLRLYEPTSGAVRLDGVDLRELEPADVRARTGVLFQDFVRWNLTVGENVGLGWLPRLDDRAALDDAAARAGADEVVARLPAGWDTVLGRWYGGEQLSIGQWQRVALARAFFRPADLLVLDEPSSALDPEAEARLFERLDELKQGRTAIFVTHRLTAVRRADRIAVLDGGRLVEVGRHDELVAAGGLYARMFAAQARAYREG